MNQQLTLASPEIDGVTLRSIVATDQENLCQWKNANRFAFFYQESISPEEQARWFQGYLERTNDWMFVVEAEGRVIGCLGFRLLEGEAGDHADVYNVILGDATMGRRGWMRRALRLLCSFILARFTREIGVKVLSANSAVEWYQKTGFRLVADHENHVDLRLDLTHFQPCAFKELP